MRRRWRGEEGITRSLHLDKLVASFDIRSGQSFACGVSSMHELLQVGIFMSSKQHPGALHNPVRS